MFLQSPGTCLERRGGPLQLLRRLQMEWSIFGHISAAYCADDDDGGGKEASLLSPFV